MAIALRDVQDGVTVAKAIEFKDRFQNMGAQLVRQVASKTNDVAGDGTTTATVLARAIFAEGCKAVVAGLNPMDLRRGMQLAVERVLEHLKAASVNITSSAEIAQVRHRVCAGAVVPQSIALCASGHASIEVYAVLSVAATHSPMVPIPMRPLGGHHFRERRCRGRRAACARHGEGRERGCYHGSGRANPARRAGDGGGHEV